MMCTVGYLRYFLACFFLVMTTTVFCDKRPVDPHPRLATAERGPGYTINFDNVSVIEFIKFVSKIGDVNFIYPEEELTFNVTIVSEEPTDLSNIMAALIQVLRINGFDLIDDGQNLLIHRAGESGGLATVVSPEIPFTGEKPPPIVTRVFKIRNGNPMKISSILRPMLSPGVMMEVSVNTRHLIITDLTANIDKVADLLLSLDAPQTPLEMDSYTAKNNDVEEMVKLATEILTPISEDNPLIMVPQDSTHTVFVVSTPFLIEKTLMVLEDLDTPSMSKQLQGNNIFLYQLQYRPAGAVLKALDQIADSFQSMGYGSSSMSKTLEHAKYIRATNSLLFTGPTDDIAKIKEIISTIDTQDKASTGTFFLYKPKYRQAKEIAKSLKEIADDIEESASPDESLIYTIEQMKIVPQTHAILFSGDANAISHLKMILESIDVPTEQEEVKLNKKFLIYKLQSASEDEMEKSLHNLAETLEDSGVGNEELIHAIDSMKYIKTSHSMVFTGTAEAIKRLNEILPTFDTPELASSKDFYMYTPKNEGGEELEKSVHDIADNLKKSGLADPAFLRTLNTVKWMPASKTLVFTGDTQSLARIHELMQTIDVPDEAAGDRVQVFIYTIQYIAPKVLEKALTDLADNLPKDSDLHRLINSMKYAEKSNSLVFKGPQKAIKKLQDILASLDNKTQEKVVSSESATYELIPLKNVSGALILKDLHRMVKNLEASNAASPELIRSINSIEWIKSTNSLYIPGTPDTLQKIKALIEQFDVERKDAATSHFFVYKPQYLTGPEIIHSLQDMAGDLKDSGLSDAEILNAIDSAKYVPSSDTIVFTGGPDALAKIESLLKTIDNSSAAQTATSGLGATTFLIYKVQHVQGKQLLAHLNHVVTDLDAPNSEDKALAKTIKGARWAPETNSIVFTGPQKILARVEALAKKFDLASLAPKSDGREPESFILYQPQYVKGPELIQVMDEFETNLKNSGVDDPELFDAIDSLKWISKTSSILVSGDQGSIKRVEELLTRFDTSATSGDHEAPTIDNVDDVSFLIYKLQYHSGTEIESALRKIAFDMAQAKTGDRNQDLINAIQSVQWIETTNSLVGSGTPKTLLKLRDLLKGIDVPLKQVFIEVLVIETDLNNALELGLRWGSQGKYRNKLGWSGGAFPRTNQGATDPFIGFNDELNTVNAGNGPNPTKIGFGSGFSLGVIGDIIFHKGQSYAALGSLVDAIRVDGDVTIILSQKLITQDNKQSTLFVGDNIPFNSSTVSNQVTSGGIISTANIEYRDIGVTLNITPRVGQDGMVTIVIDEEISEQSNTGQQSGGSNQVTQLSGIQTTKTSTQTQVTMPNNYFLVLTGSMRTTKTRNRQSIPCLGALPVVGALFQHNETLTENKNVIIFVKPQIIETFDVYKKITENQEDLFRTQSVAEDFDEGLEYVVTPDDDEDHSQ